MLLVVCLRRGFVVGQYRRGPVCLGGSGSTKFGGENLVEGRMAPVICYIRSGYTLDLVEVQTIHTSRGGVTFSPAG